MREHNQWILSSVSEQLKESQGQGKKAAQDTIGEVHSALRALERCVKSLVVRVECVEVAKVCSVKNVLECVWSECECVCSVCVVCVLQCVWSVWRCAWSWRMCGVWSACSSFYGPLCAAVRVLSVYCCVCCVFVVVCAVVCVVRLMVGCVLQCVD